MNNEVRKPREFYIQLPSDSFKTYEIVRRFISTKKFEPIGLEAEIIHCREILPGDDSIRKRTIAVSDVKEMLEDFRSDAKRMRGEFHRLYEEINNLIKRIDRESKGE